MTDPISWALLAGIEESVGKIDTANIETVVTDTSAKLTQSMEKLAADVKKETSEMHTVVAQAPSGVPAPSLAAFSAASAADGISVTVTANDSTVESNSAKNVLAVTKGVMVRYSDVGYPKNKEDGVLAFADDDLFDVNTAGTRVAKAKTHKVTGLTLNSTYYFSAFPYSTGMVYNEQLGAPNVTNCKWTGIKGNLTVNVTTNNPAFSLDQYTISLKPTNGDAITKQQTGIGNVVFSDIDAGVYTLSFTYNGMFNKPADQQVTVVAGQTKTASAQFKISSNFGSASWEEISRISASGKADKVYSVGDTKNITVNGETVTLQIYGFNHDPIAGGGGNAGITLGMKHLLKDTRQMNSSDTNRGGFTGSAMYSWLNGAFYNGLPADLKAVIKSVNKKTSAGNASSTINTNAMKVFLFSNVEVFGTTDNSVICEGVKYPIFTNNASRIKKLSNGSGSAYYWWLRSPYASNTSGFCSVYSDGTSNWYDASNSGGVCAGFCI